VEQHIELLFTNSGEKPMNFPSIQGDFNSLGDHEVHNLIAFYNIQVKSNELIDSKKNKLKIFLGL
jgi:hypothetical protein